MKPRRILRYTLVAVALAVAGVAGGRRRRKRPTALVVAPTPATPPFPMRFSFDHRSPPTVKMVLTLAYAALANLPASCMSL